MARIRCVTLDTMKVTKDNKLHLESIVQLEFSRGEVNLGLNYKLYVVLMKKEAKPDALFHKIQGYTHTGIFLQELEEKALENGVQLVYDKVVSANTGTIQTIAISKQVRKKQEEFYHPDEYKLFAYIIPEVTASMAFSNEIQENTL